MTYTLKFNAQPAQTGLSLEDAAVKRLNCDGYFFEITQDQDDLGWVLWCSNHSRNSPIQPKLVKTVIYSIKDDEAEAYADIMKKVAFSAEDMFPGWIEADEDYAKMTQYEKEPTYVYFASLSPHGHVEFGEPNIDVIGLTGTAPHGVRDGNWLHAKPIYPAIIISAWGPFYHVPNTLVRNDAELIAWKTRYYAMKLWRPRVGGEGDNCEKNKANSELNEALGNDAVAKMIEAQGNE